VPTPAALFALLTLAAFTAGGCSGPEQMSGFPLKDARAQVQTQPADDPCAIRSGRLVLEVAQAIVREYPHTELARLKRAKQPMLLLWVTGARQPGRPPEVDLTHVSAPEDYRPGDRIHFFEGLRLLDRPLRTLHGRGLELRLAENDRTSAPQWVQVAHTIAGAGAGAAGAAGVPVPPSGAIDLVIELLRKLDRDDLILIWSTDADTLARELFAPPRMLRVHLTTPRRVRGGPGDGLPTAELDLLLYLEAEAGCP